MNKVNIDNMTFESHDDVLNRIELHESKSWFKRIKNLLDYEIEIPLSGLVVTFACWIALVGFNIKDEAYIYEYPIVVIESGGAREIY